MLRMFLLLNALLALTGCDAGGPEATSRTASQAVARTVEIELSVPGMTCPACPITVRKALEAVPGVGAVEVDFDHKTARVRYDPDRATPEQLLQATANAGYPAQPVLANRTGESP